MRQRPKFKMAALLLTTMLGLSACAAGGPGTTTNTGDGGTAAGEKTTISFWTPFSGGDGEFMTAMIDKFNQENSEIRVEQLANKAEDYYTKLQTAIASDQAPDLTVLHSARMPQFVPAGFVTPLDELASEVQLDWGEFNPTILDSTVYDEKHYSVPLDTHAIVMYYNKDYLKDAGVLGDDGNPIYDKSPEGFTEFLNKIKAAAPKDVAPLAQPSVRIDSYWMFWGFYNQLKDGGKFYDESGKAELNNPQALQALEYVDSLYTSGLIPPKIDDAVKLFQDKRAAVLITGVWSTGSFENIDGLDFGVVPMPQIYDQPATWGDSHTLALPKHGKEDPAKQKAALTFAKWLADNGEMWAKAGHIPSVTKVLDSQAFKDMPYRSDYAESANFVKYWPRNDKQGQVNDNVVKEFEKMMAGKQDAKTTLEKANAAIDKTTGK
ncbi:ABC transporter substrate-binding protein [Saccharibacillus sp. CPCC 101409]|uniref:ABC transporter substrate-binding protein n=1 Tax=Saccharibacillus sp. CPCC 101409 TaxID=3058041 RepID=UPI002671C701|nr:ABC transporter substrate-binding protein [Saccharibacillus sp. CPCC 101409]MDO3409998.1 ABC transporter substrate-binding protein [Saccharibacillus sp. CPCC 101409]